MSEWKAYMHIERLDSEEVEGLLDYPDIFVCSKLDGANASVFINGYGQLQTAKRTKPLENDDFRGLPAYVETFKDKYLAFFNKYPNTIIYAEWLVKHSISYYRESAWNKLYAYDVLDLNTGNFIRSDKVVEMFKEFDIEQVPPMAVINGPIVVENVNEFFNKFVQQNKFLIDDLDKIGEGIVIKAFNGDQPYKNKYGRTEWAKIVTQEFKEKNTIEFGSREVNLPLEWERIFTEQFITPARVEKLKQKIQDDRGTGWQSKYIAELLGRTYYDVFSEELWGFVKKNNVKNFNFGILNKLVVLKIKQILGI